MARMHTRRKGQAGSKKPIRTEPPKWSNTNKEEIENTIQQLASGGKGSSEIGMILREKDCLNRILDQNKVFHKILYLWPTER